MLTGGFCEILGGGDFADTPAVQKELPVKHAGTTRDDFPDPSPERDPVPVPGGVLEQMARDSEVPRPGQPLGFDARSPNSLYR
jgi:hypothetical protein